MDAVLCYLWSARDKLRKEEVTIITIGFYLGIAIIRAKNVLIRLAKEKPIANCPAPSGWV